MNLCRWVGVVRVCVGLGGGGGCGGKKNNKNFYNSRCKYMLFIQVFVWMCTWFCYICFYLFILLYFFHVWQQALYCMLHVFSVCRLCWIFLECPFTCSWFICPGSLCWIKGLLWLQQFEKRHIFSILLFHRNSLFCFSCLSLIFTILSFVLLLHFPWR